MPSFSTSFFGDVEENMCARVYVPFKPSGSAAFLIPHNPGPARDASCLSPVRQMRECRHVSSPRNLGCSAKRTGHRLLSMVACNVMLAASVVKKKTLFYPRRGRDSLKSAPTSFWGCSLEPKPKPKDLFLTQKLTWRRGETGTPMAQVYNEYFVENAMVEWCSDDTMVE